MPINTGFYKGRKISLGLSALSDRGFSAWEFVLALLVIFMLMVLGLNIYFGILQASKEAALKSTLGSIRSAVELIYRAKSGGKFPDGVTPGQRIEDLIENRNKGRSLPLVDLGERRMENQPPLSNKVHIDSTKDDKPIKLPLNSEGGYAYKPATGEIRLNVDPSFKDSEGKPFSEY